jgi:hypothetical protein
MQWKTVRAALPLLATGVALASPSVAPAAHTQLAGVAVYDTTGVCPGPPAGFEDYTSVPPLVMSGSLQGCWYTKIVTATDNGAPSAVYQERGAEIFVGTLDGGAVGTFTTTYKFTSKWDPDVSTGSEVRGRCEHPIAAGSGTGGFAGASGRVDFKDEVTTGAFLFRGHISLG